MTAEWNESDDAGLGGLDEFGELDGFGELDAEALSAIEEAFGADALDLLTDDSDDLGEAGAIDEFDAVSLDQTLDQADGSRETGDIDESGLPVEQLLEQIDAGEAGWAELRSRAAVAAEARRYLGVQVGGDGYFLPLECVAEVQRVPRVSFVPFVPAWVAGVCNFRGQVVSAVELRAYFSGPSGAAGAAGAAGATVAAGEPSASARIVFVRTQPPDLCVGLLVEGVGGVRSLGDDDVEPIPPMMRNRVASYLAGTCRVGEQTWCLLDADRMLRAEEFRQVDRGG
jgi:purine-binding chemotaxis protein CheW